MALPYQFFRSLQDSRALPFNMELEVSLTLADGIPLLYSANGKLTPIVNNTDRALFVLNGSAATTSTGSQVNLSQLPFPIVNQIGGGFNAQQGPGGNPQVTQLGGFADVLPAQNGLGIWRTSFTPVGASFISNATGSTTSIICPSSPATYAANVLAGGTLYCSTTGQQAQITANTSVTAANPVTLTIATPLAANADGMSFSFTPLGKGRGAVKYDTSAGTVANSGYVPSQTIADYTGGVLTIHEVDLQAQLVYVIFN